MKHTLFCGDGTKFGDSVRHTLKPIMFRFIHFRGVLSLVAITQCKRCKRIYSNRWSTSRFMLNNYIQPKREIIRLEAQRLEKEIRDLAGDYNA